MGSNKIFYWWAVSPFTIILKEKEMGGHKIFYCLPEFADYFIGEACEKGGFHFKREVTAVIAEQRGGENFIIRMNPTANDRPELKRGETLFTGEDIQYGRVFILEG